MEPTSHLRFLCAIAGLVAAVGCNPAPEITNTQVTPSSFQISGLASNAQFTISTDVLNFSGTVMSVTATVEGQSELGPYHLTQGSSVPGGANWSVATQLVLPSGFADGTYQIDIAAVDSDGTTTTKVKAAQLTISG